MQISQKKKKKKPKKKKKFGGQSKKGLQKNGSNMRVKPGVQKLRAGGAEKPPGTVVEWQWRGGECVWLLN